MNQEQESAVVRRVLAGEREAFALLVEAHHPALFHLALVVTGSRDLAEDVVQETFVLGYDRLATWRPERGRLFPWLYVICRNLARRRGKARSRLLTGQATGDQEGQDLETAADDQGEGPETAVLQGEQGRTLTRCLLRLPLDMREALSLRFLEDMSFNEIAAVLGISAQAAKMRVYRGLEKLREIVPPDWP